MKFILSIVIILLLTISLNGQTTFPITVGVAWDANPVADNVTEYRFTHTAVGANPISFTLAPGSCTVTTCTQNIVITSSAQQTVSVVAVNVFGVSAPTTLSFTATIPGKSNNIRIVTAK